MSSLKLLSISCLFCFYCFWFLELASGLGSSIDPTESFYDIMFCCIFDFWEIESRGFNSFAITLISFCGVATFDLFSGEALDATWLPTMLFSIFCRLDTTLYAAIDGPLVSDLLLFVFCCFWRLSFVGNSTRLWWTALSAILAKASTNSLKRISMCLVDLISSILVCNAKLNSGPISRAPKLSSQTPDIVTSSINRVNRNVFGSPGLYA